MSRRILFVLILLASSLYATNVDAEFWDLPTKLDTYFDTNMQFTTDFTLSAVSGAVSSGDPTNLRSGDTVCSGATLMVTPTVNAKWAVSDLDIVSVYPTCPTFGYCPAMISYPGGVNTNRDIGWLPTSTFNDHQAFGDAYPLTRDISRYNQLGTFHVQPITYTNVTGVYHSNKEGGANIFCKGTLEVRDGGTVVATSELPATDNLEFTVSTSGSHAIQTRLSGVSCFGAVVKHPLNIADYPQYFYLYYFAHNAPPIPATIATDTMTINVQAGGDPCSMHETEVTASGSLTAADIVMVKITMHNDDDQMIRVTGVSGSNPGYTVERFPLSMCPHFSSSLCPSSNGFDEAISPGGDKDLYVLIWRTPGASGGTVLTFNAATVSTTCGGAGVCDDDVDLRGPITCDITPPSLSLGTQEVAEFLVDCQDLAGDPISCIGNDWYWNDGLTGDFVEKGNTHALAYTTSTAGSTGTLRYRSRVALCSSDIEVVPPKYECELIPSSARMSPSDSQYFQLNSFVDDNPSTPDDADYDLIDGLTGTLSGSDTAGTSYKAPSGESSGDLRAYAFWDDPTDDPILGSVCMASIDVTTSNITGDGDGGEGASEYCTIGDGPLSVDPGYEGWVGIRCGEYADEDCFGVHWSMTEGVISGDDNGAYITVTGRHGTSGQINAYVNNDPGQSCYLPFSIWTSDCWEFS